MKNRKAVIFGIVSLTIFLIGEFAFLFSTLESVNTTTKNQNISQEIRDVVDPNTGCKKDWNTHVSTRFGYKICYPNTWHAILYDENDKKIYYGTHSIFSYNYKNAINYSKKGIINWKDFVGEEPQVKFDIDIANAVDKNVKIENTELKLVSQDKISGQGYWNIQKQVGENIVSLNIYTNNYKDTQTLTNSKNWKTMLEIIDSIK